MIKKLMLVGIIATHCYATEEQKQGDVGQLSARLRTQTLDDQHKNATPVTDPMDNMITTYINGENGKKISVYGEGL